MQILPERKGTLGCLLTRTQIFVITLSYLLAKQLWGLLLNFDWLVHDKLSVQTIQPQILIYISGNFKYN